MILDRYLDYREQMQTGDVIAFQGNGLYSKAIQWWTRSPYSHVALVVRFDQLGVDRVFLLHALVEGGVVLMPASFYLSRASGAAEWVPLKHPLALLKRTSYLHDLFKFSMLQLGRSYDARGILKFLVPGVKESKASYFCSELVSDAYKHIGLTERTFVSPGELLSWPIFETRRLL